MIEIKTYEQYLELSEKVNQLAGMVCAGLLTEAQEENFYELLEVTTAYSNEHLMDFWDPSIGPEYCLQFLVPPS